MFAGKWQIEEWLNQGYYGLSSTDVKGLSHLMSFGHGQRDHGGRGSLNPKVHGRKGEIKETEELFLRCREPSETDVNTW